MENELFDIAIIGGGLAGLTLAIQCADKGYRAILFEKETYPFHKVCGEYISMESKPFLQTLGVPFVEWNLPFIHQLNVSVVSGKSFSFNLPERSTCPLSNAFVSVSREDIGAIP